jgi:hypothetical protein
MQLAILENRNLKVSLDRGEKDLIHRLLDRHCGNDLTLLDDLLDQTGLLGNAKLYQVSADAIGALTCAPIVTDLLEWNDDGSIKEVGNVWWFTAYEARNFAEDFLRQGHVIFQYADATKMN